MESIVYDIHTRMPIIDFHAINVLIIALDVYTLAFFLLLLYTMFLVSFFFFCLNSNETLRNYTLCSTLRIYVWVTMANLEEPLFVRKLSLNTCIYTTVIALTIILTLWYIISWLEETNNILLNFNPCVFVEMTLCCGWARERNIHSNFFRHEGQPIIAR